MKPNISKIQQVHLIINIGNYDIRYSYSETDFMILINFHILIGKEKMIFFGC